jgi:hypothetical protein
VLERTAPAVDVARERCGIREQRDEAAPFDLAAREGEPARRASRIDGLFVEHAEQVQRREPRRLRHLHVAHEQSGDEVGRERGPEFVGVEGRWKRPGRPPDGAQVGDDLGQRVDARQQGAGIGAVTVEQRLDAGNRGFDGADELERVAHDGKIFARGRRLPSLAAHQRLERVGRGERAPKRIDHVDQRLAEAAEHDRVGHQRASASDAGRCASGVTGAVVLDRILRSDDITMFPEPGPRDRKGPAAPPCRRAWHRRSAVAA